MTATGQDILNLAKQHLGEHYVFGVVAPKDDPNWAGPWDCAELVSWCVYQATKKLYGCTDDMALPALADAYTGAWARDSVYIGQRVSWMMAADRPGAALLRYTSKVGHIAISDGQGGTVEAHSTNLGVIESTVHGRRWDCGVLVPWIDYEREGNVVIKPLPTIYRYKIPMMTGNKVREIQEALQIKGKYLTKVDGIFGPLTQAAVLHFQISKGLVPDGEVGPVTLRSLGLI